MNLLWIDLETTGSNWETGQILEVGYGVTDFLGEPLSDIYRSVVYPPNGIDLVPVVFEMHVKSGLWEDIPKGIALKDAESQVLSLAGQHLHNGSIILAGSGVGHFDRKWIDAYMPRLAKKLGYWVVDVGVVRRMTLAIGGAWLPSTKTHRGDDDVRYHIKEYRHGLELLRKGVE